MLNRFVVRCSFTSGRKSQRRPSSQRRDGLRLVCCPVLILARARGVVCVEHIRPIQVRAHGGRRDGRDDSLVHLSRNGDGGRRQHQGSLVILVETRQLDQPLLPLGGRREQVVTHVTEKLYLHNVDFRDRECRNLCPCFIGIGVVIQNCETWLDKS